MAVADSSAVLDAAAAEDVAGQQTVGLLLLHLLLFFYTSLYATPGSGSAGAAL